MQENCRDFLFSRAARGEKTERTPVWLMRQAGRTDPEYVRIREEAPLPLEELFRHPELAARISLLPRRYGVDAIIFYQDILTPLAPMGASFVFRPGPVLEGPIGGTQDLGALTLYDVAEALSFVPETLRLVRSALEGELPVLGFAGAPWTLLAFLLEGGSFGVSADRAVDFLHREPMAAHAVLDKLTRMTIDYLLLQIAAGAAAVQLFESAAYLLSPALYKEFALRYQQRIFAALKDKAPTIVFARDWPVLEDLDASGADILSLSGKISLREARGQLGPQRALQGNLSNRLLVAGPLDAIRDAARDCVAAGNRQGHIFNLDHGLLKETPFDHVVELVRYVRSLTVS